MAIVHSFAAEGRPVLCAFCSDQYAAVRWNASAEVVDRIEVYYICHYPNGSEVSVTIIVVHFYILMSGTILSLASY